jgi:hypothetical protein
MSACYLLRTNPSNQLQNENDLSFVGGRPRIPNSTAIPTCQLCGAELTFFFQVAFPDKHEWSELSMAVFACTSCAHEEYLIPEMLKGPLPGADIPEQFLEAYQKNFRILVFVTNEGTVKADYREKIQFSRWNLVTTPAYQASENKIGGVPNWLLDDEAPSTYNAGVPMIFLMQLLEEFKFDIVQDAPPQIRIGLRGKPQPSKHRYYEPFLGNNVYFFGTADHSKPLVYIVTQI